MSKFKIGDRVKCGNVVGTIKKKCPTFPDCWDIGVERHDSCHEMNLTKIGETMSGINKAIEKIDELDEIWGGALGYRQLKQVLEAMRDPEEKKDEFPIYCDQCTDETKHGIHTCEEKKPKEERQPAHNHRKDGKWVCPLCDKETGNIYAICECFKNTSKKENEITRTYEIKYTDYEGSFGSMALDTLERVLEDYHDRGMIVLTKKENK